MPSVSLKLWINQFDDGLVPVVATEVGVAGGRLHLEDAVGDLEHARRRRCRHRGRRRAMVCSAEPLSRP
jgi:hypothetical protein